MSGKAEWNWIPSTILLPLAFEQREWTAVYAAFVLAEYSGSRVKVFHVVTDQDNEERTREMTRELHKLAETYKVTFSITQSEGKVLADDSERISGMIVNESEKEDIGAIVMSAFKETFIREFFGRVSDRVARKARRRVILVETPKPGIRVPHNPKRIVIPILGEKVHSEPFIIAAAFTSSAAARDFEIIAAKSIRLPATLPMDSIESSKTLQDVMRNFEREIGLINPFLGRVVIPKALIVRDTSDGISTFAAENQADMLILGCNKPGRFGPTITKEEYAVVRKTDCIALVTFAGQPQL
jgi:nucleotide-binding universal stress UspA family protein